MSQKYRGRAHFCVGHFNPAGSHWVYSYRISVAETRSITNQQNLTKRKKERGVVLVVTDKKKAIFPKGRIRFCKKHIQQCKKLDGNSRSFISDCSFQDTSLNIKASRRGQGYWGVWLLVTVLSSVSLQDWPWQSAKASAGRPRAELCMSTRRRCAVSEKGCSRGRRPLVRGSSHIPISSCRVLIPRTLISVLRRTTPSGTSDEAPCERGVRS